MIEPCLCFFTHYLEEEENIISRVIFEYLNQDGHHKKGFCNMKILKCAKFLSDPKKKLNVLIAQFCHN